MAEDQGARKVELWRRALTLMRTAFFRNVLEAAKVCEPQTFKQEIIAEVLPDYFISVRIGSAFAIFLAEIFPFSLVRKAGMLNSVSRFNFKRRLEALQMTARTCRAIASSVSTANNAEKSGGPLLSAFFVMLLITTMWKGAHARVCAEKCLPRIKHTNR